MEHPPPVTWLLNNVIAFHVSECIYTYYVRECHYEINMNFHRVQNANPSQCSGYLIVVSLKGTNCLQKTRWICHVYCTFQPGICVRLP